MVASCVLPPSGSSDVWSADTRDPAVHSTHRSTAPGVVGFRRLCAVSLVMPPVRSTQLGTGSPHDPSRSSERRPRLLCLSPAAAWADVNEREPCRLARSPQPQPPGEPGDEPRPAHRDANGAQNGRRQRKPENRAKSPSVVIHSHPDSTAIAASHASWTRLPVTAAARHRSSKIAK